MSKITNRNPISNFFLTVSQVSDDETKELFHERVTNKLYADDNDWTEYIVAEELHSDGGRHFHAYYKLKKPMKLREAPAFFHVLEHSCDCQPCRSCTACIQYCSKDGDYISNIIEKVKNHRKRLTVSSNTILTNTTAQAFEKRLITYGQARPYQYMRSILMSSKTYNHHTTRGYWFVGPSGSGKSRAARFTSLIKGDRYMKPQNKWWDGYENQPIVVLDDLDTSTLGHYLKIWGDRYHFSAEIKGVNICPCYTHFIVTSNYTIEELFKDNLIMVEPIMRRFQVVEFPSLEEGNQLNIFQSSPFMDVIIEEFDDDPDSVPDSVSDS